MRGKDVVGIVTFDLIGLLPTNHIIILQGHVGVYEETFDANMKIAQTTRNTIAEILLSKRQVCRRNGKLRRSIIQEISYSNLETGRYGPKSGVSRPDYPGEMMTL